MDAVVALRNFIDGYDEEGLQQVKPLIPQLLDVFFQLMQEVSLSCNLYLLLFVAYFGPSGQEANVPDNSSAHVLGGMMDLVLPSYLHLVTSSQVKLDLSKGNAQVMLALHN